MSGFAVKAVIVLVVITLVVVIVARFFRRVAPASATRRQRMPIFVPLAGGALLVAGAALGFVSFASRYTDDLLALRIASVVVFLAGVAVLLAHRNRYLDVGADAVRFRTVLGREHRIAYRDIVSFRIVRILGRERVVVRSADGVQLAADVGCYRLAPLLEAGRSAAS
ncbi:hypothetical protein Q9R19_00020 [Microbacterium sp. ARD32]|uniref:hypothetical protein n=1 Tax=Microbacterium sp. ARD32 TaxID=2962577 RepID=UPI0028811F9C|nr:hypothetical protein [Microbacterium sp. ARD32]MDT0156004.1 hypothetical protein [Microbacterium sp. ARD32]